MLQSKARMTMGMWMMVKIVVCRRKKEEREDGGGVGEILKKLDSIAPSILPDNRIWLQESKILNY